MGTFNDKASKEQARAEEPKGKEALEAETAFNAGLLDFVAASPTPFHATANLCARLHEAGFQPLDETDAWQLTPGQGYYLTRNESALIAFRQPLEPWSECGLRLVGAHTDSPCLKVKPAPDIQRQGCQQLGVEVYGGALLNPWFDRDLSLAGRVSFSDPAGRLLQVLVDWPEPLATIPSLAIHLDRDQNQSRSVNPQTQMPLLLGLAEEDAPSFRQLLRERLEAEGAEVADILDFEIFCYDSQPPALLGRNREFIAGARLDNLLSCYLGLQSLVDGDLGGAMLVCNDHEEVGSMSSSGAQGPFLENLIMRLVPETEERSRMLARSRLVSADNAHAVHPNFSDKHDNNHGPRMNQGPVIKVNANQRYASNSVSSAWFRQLATREEVPVQVFTVRADMACGSTIGPLTATRLGVETLDVGVPTLGMHSIRELAGTKDAYLLYRVLRRFQSRAY